MERGELHWADPGTGEVAKGRMTDDNFDAWNAYALHERVGQRAAQALRSHAQTIMAADPGVQSVVLFGSRARGDAHELSDWDIAVVHNDPYRHVDMPEANRMLALAGIPMEMVSHFVMGSRLLALDGAPRDNMSRSIACQGLLLCGNHLDSGLDRGEQDEQETKALISSHAAMASRHMQRLGELRAASGWGGLRGSAPVFLAHEAAQEWTRCLVWSAHGFVPSLTAKHMARVATSLGMDGVAEAMEQADALARRPERRSHISKLSSIALQLQNQYTRHVQDQTLDRKECKHDNRMLSSTNP